MNNKDLKNVTKLVEMMKFQYGVESFVIDTDHVHPRMICKMAKTSVEIICQGLPNTSGTELKHVAQNALKRVREGEKLGKNLVSYGGGKG